MNHPTSNGIQVFKFTKNENANDNGSASPKEKNTILVPTPLGEIRIDPREPIPPHSPLGMYYQDILDKGKTLDDMNKMVFKEMIKAEIKDTPVRVSEDQHGNYYYSLHGERLKPLLCQPFKISLFTSTNNKIAVTVEWYNQYKASFITEIIFIGNITEDIASSFKKFTQKHCLLNSKRDDVSMALCSMMMNKARHIEIPPHHGVYKNRKGSFSFADSEKYVMSDMRIDRLDRTVNSIALISESVSDNREISYPSLIAFIIKLAIVLFPVISEWGYAPYKPLMLIADENAQQSIIQTLLFRKPQILQKNSVTETLTNQNNCSELSICYYDNSKTEMLTQCTELLRTGSYKGNKVCSLPVFISDSFPYNDSDYSNITGESSFFFIQWDKTDSKIIADYQEFLNKQEHAHATAEKWLNEEDYVFEGMEYIVVATAFASTVLKNIAESDWLDLLIQMKANNSRLAAYNLIHHFAAELERIVKEEGTIHISKVPENEAACRICYDADFIYIPNHVFRMICSRICSKYIGSTEIKKLLKEEGILVSDAQGSYQHKIRKEYSKNTPRVYQVRRNAECISELTCFPKYFTQDISVTSNATLNAEKIPHYISLGQSKDGEVFMTDSSRNKNILIYGASGYGKTKAVQSYISQRAEAKDTIIVFDKDGSFQGKEVHKNFAHIFKQANRIHLVSDGINLELFMDVGEKKGSDIILDAFVNSFYLTKTECIALKKAVDDLSDTANRAQLTDLVSSMNHTLNKKEIGRLSPVIDFINTDIFSPDGKQIKMRAINIIELGGLDEFNQNKAIEFILAILIEKSMIHGDLNTPVVICLDEFQEIYNGKKSKLPQKINLVRKKGMSFILSTQKYNKDSALQSHALGADTLVVFHPIEEDMRQMAQFLHTKNKADCIEELANLNQGECLVRGELIINNTKIQGPAHIVDTLHCLSLRTREAALLNKDICLGLGYTPNKNKGGKR